MRILPSRPAVRYPLLFALLVLVAGGAILLFARPSFPGEVTDIGWRLVREQRWRYKGHPHMSEINGSWLEDWGAAAPSEDGKTVWVAAEDHLFRFGDLPEIGRLSGARIRRRSLTPMPEENRLLIRGVGPQFEMYRLSDLGHLRGPYPATRVPREGEVLWRAAFDEDGNPVSVPPDDQAVVLGVLDGRILWRKTCEPGSRLFTGRGRTRAVLVLPDGRLQLWDVPGARGVVERKDATAKTICVFTPDERRVAVGPLADGRFAILETDAGRVLGRLDATTGPKVVPLADRFGRFRGGFDRVHLDADGRFLAVDVHAADHVRVLDVETGETATFSGTLLAAGSSHAVFDHERREIRVVGPGPKSGPPIRVPGILERAVPAENGPWLAVLVREEPSDLSRLLGKKRKRRTVLVIDLRTSEVVLAPVFLGRSQFGFSPSGNTFALFEAHGNLRTWKILRP